MRPLILKRLSSLLTSGVVAGFLIAGSAAFAQHGGYAGHGGFAGHAGGFSSRGFSGSITGFPGQISTLAPHAITMPGRAVFGAPAHAFAPGFVPSWTGSQPAWSNRGGWRDGGDRRDRGYGRNGYGYGVGYPYYGSSWELLPYDLGYSDVTGDDGDDSAAQQGSAQNTVAAPPPDSGYRPEYPGYEGDPYPGQQAYAAPPAPAAPIAPEPELTLIYKDGHTQAIHNYVLTASDLVVLDEAAAGRQQRIPLSELNLPATEEAAQQAGLDFSPPA
ncbi:MAG: hypothetical protein WB622_16680 [Acidobacteriaceae bacterium]